MLFPALVPTMTKVLCIEDEEDLLFDICAELRDAGYEVVSADNGADGLRLIRSEIPDIVLCDIRMPIMDGYELLSIIRASKDDWSCTPFIFLTAYGEREDMLRGLRAGADDFLTKPIDYDVMLMRVETSLRQVERIKEQIKVKQQGLTKELMRALNMQRDLLPSRETERVLERAYNIRLTSHYEPSTEVGGDIWGIQLISSMKFMLYLVDFSGHGIAAAMNTFRMHSKIDSGPITNETPKEYLEYLNQWLCEHMQTGQYATVLIGVVDFENEVFEYAAAGSTAPIRINSMEQSVEVGSGKGVPLGISKKAVYENRQLPFKMGDGIFLYSDALVEHGRKEKLDLGHAGVEKLVLQVASMTNDLIVEDILAPFLSVAPRPLNDDLTAVCCIWKY